MNQDFVRLQCPDCSKKLKIPSAKARKKIVCPKCSQLFKCPPKPAEDNLGIAIDSNGNPIAKRPQPEVWQDPDLQMLPALPEDLQETPINEAELVDTEAMKLESVTDEDALLKPKKRFRSGSRSGSHSGSGSGVTDSNYWADSGAATSPESRTNFSRAQVYKSVTSKKPPSGPLSPRDEWFKQFGITLVIFGIGASILPMVGLQWRRMSFEGTAAPIAGMVFGLIGSGLIGWAKRRNRTEAAIAAGCLAVAITCVSGTAFLYQSRIVGGAIEPVRKAAGEDAGGPRRATHLDHGLLPRIQKQRDREPNDPITVSRPRQGDRNSSQSGAGTNTDDKKMSKRNDFRIRASFLQSGQTENQFEQGFTIIGSAGKVSSNSGELKLIAKPEILGIDTLFDESGTLEILIPIEGQARYEDSLVHSRGYLLAGLNLNISDDRFIGVQAVFAPMAGGKLDLRSRVTSKWQGTAASETDAVSLLSDGRRLAGLVISESADGIDRIALVAER